MNLKQARRKEWHVRTSGHYVEIFAMYMDRRGYSYSFVVHEFPMYVSPRHPSKRELMSHARYIANLHNTQLKLKAAKEVGE